MAPNKPRRPGASAWGRPPALDLVRDSKLTTTFLPDGATQHVRYAAATAPGSAGAGRPQRPQKTTEMWRRRRHLGSGTFGTVWLEECEAGASRGQLRAVKEIRKMEGSEALAAVDYERELEAVVKFSQDSVGC